MQLKKTKEWITMEKTDKNNIFETDEHILHMWEPLNFKVEPGYDYLRNGIWHKILYFLLRSFAWLILTFFNRFAFGFEIEGEHNLDKLGKQGAVTICNHIHPMDCTMVNIALLRKRVYYITLERNFKIPIIRHVIRILGAVPLPNNYHCAGEMFESMGEAVKGSSCVQIYPEAVMSPYHKGLRNFKNGAFQMAFDNNVPILPMAIKQVEPDKFYSLYKTKPCLRLVILPPVYPNVTLERNLAVSQLKEECYDLMSQVLLENNKNHSE